MKKRKSIFKNVLKYIRREYDVKPIKLLIGSDPFWGVEWDHIEQIEPNLNGSWPEPSGVQNWLLVKACPEGIEFLGNGFYGKEFDIYGERYGENYIFISKHKKHERHDVDWHHMTWKKYINKSPEFDIVYLDNFNEINSINY